MNEISLIIPVYNEEKRIKLTLSNCISYFKNKKINYEIIIVDDGSTDKTRLIVKDFSNKNKNIKLTKQRNNKGKGYSVKEDMLLARGDYLLFSDADLSTPIREVEKFIKVIKSGYDIVIASRNMKGSIIPIKQPFFRSFLGSLLSLFSGQYYHLTNFFTPFGNYKLKELFKSFAFPKLYK